MGSSQAFWDYQNERARKQMAEQGTKGGAAPQGG